MTKPLLNVALIGYAFMGRAHSNALRQVGRFFPDCPYDLRLKVLAGRSEAPLKEAAATLGWEEWSTDVTAILRRPDIQVVDLGTPNDSHHDLALAALRAGKIVLCEKPLALTTAQARAMAEAARQAGRPSLVWHNYRRCPAVATAAALIREGRLGAIRQVRAVYLQDWLHDDSCPAVWRMDAAVCGSGAHGDLNAHLIDLTRHLTGLEFNEVVALQETFTPTRRNPDPQGRPARLPVTVDDAFLFLARLSNGATASYESTRVAAGRKNHNRIEINGERGSLGWNFERMNELEYFSFDDDPLVQGFRTIMCLNGAAHPWAGNYWPDGHLIGYEHTFINTLYDFLIALHHQRPFRPDFADGVANQEVLDAALLSARERRWVTVEHSQTFAETTPTQLQAGNAGR